MKLKYSQEDFEIGKTYLFYHPPRPSYMSCPGQFSLLKFRLTEDRARPLLIGFTWMGISFDKKANIRIPYDHYSKHINQYICLGEAPDKINLMTISSRLNEYERMLK